jgi:TolB-like protein
MTEKSNKLSNFWKELKRRKTAKAIVIYGATAFVILQLTDILTPALFLPPWTTTLIILLLATGFPFAIIFSWIFDFTPEGIKKTKPAGAAKSKTDTEKQSGSGKRRLQTSDLIIAALFILVVILVYPKVSGTGKTKIERDSNGKISIAVNTFENITGDTTLNTWREGIAELLIGNLGSSKELSVQNSQTMFEVYESIQQTKNASFAPSLSREAATRLNAAAYITGSFHKTGNKIRIQLKLIDTKSDALLWTGKVDGNLNSDYIELTDSLSTKVKDFLEIKAIEQNTSLDFRDAFTSSPEAYRKYIEGMNSFLMSDYPSAIEAYTAAFKIDSTFTLAAFFTSIAYNQIGTRWSIQQAAKWTQKAYEGRERLPENYRLWVEAWRAFFITKNLNEMFTYYSKLETSDLKSRYYWFDIGGTYASFGKSDKAVQAFEKIEQISSEWGGDWKFLEYYIWYANSCHNTGNHKKEAGIVEKGLDLFPDNIYLLRLQIICALSQKADTAVTSELLKKLIRIARDGGATETYIEEALAGIYWESKLPDEAEKHFRLALGSSPSNYLANYELGNFLIMTDRNIEEGMSLLNKSLEIRPGIEIVITALAGGYYKQGKYAKADSVLKVAEDSLISANSDFERVSQDIRNAIARQIK